MNMAGKEELLTANFEVMEIWSVNCPHCEFEQPAPFNHENPMQPKRHECEDCGKPFTLTYDRD